jgi:hypothetical protein
MLFFSFSAYAEDGAFVGGFGDDSQESKSTFVEEESPTSTQLPVTYGLDISGDVSQYDLSEKIIPALQTPIPVNANPGGGSGITPMSSLNNTTPNSAIQFPLNVSVGESLSATGDEAWFWTQTSQAGQLTVHFTALNSASIDYDLYVYRYDSGYLYAHKSSLRNAGVDEHISFLTTAGTGIYYIRIVSYAGGSTSSPITIYNQFTATPDASEVDDFPENARVVAANSKTTGAISIPCDEDYVKFTIPASTTGYNPMVILRLDSMNPNLSGSLYTSNLSYAGELTQTSETTQRFPAGVYYIKIHSNTLNATAADNTYAFYINTLDLGNNTIAAVLGRKSDNTKVAYMTNSSSLWVNSDQILSLLGNLSFNHSVSIVGQNSTTEKTSYLSAQSVSAVTSAQFGYYTGDMFGIVDEALALIPIGNIQCLNTVYTYNTPLGTQTSSYGGTFNNAEDYEEGKGYSAFIINLTTGAVKDFISYHNGFYNSTLPGVGGLMGNHFGSFTAY